MNPINGRAIPSHASEKFRPTPISESQRFLSQRLSYFSFNFSLRFSISLLVITLSVKTMKEMVDQPQEKDLQLAAISQTGQDEHKDDDLTLNSPADSIWTIVGCVCSCIPNISQNRLTIWHRHLPIYQMATNKIL